MLSIPRDTFVGKNKLKATSYDKINALAQKSKAPMQFSSLSKYEMRGNALR